MSTGGSVAASVAVIAAKKRELGKNPMFRMQALEGAVVKTADDTYYLDEETVARQQRFRRMLVGALLAILAATVLVLWLAA